MAPRVELQALLESILGSDNVYFQPPASVTMQYPAVVYERDAARTQFADDKPYRYTQRYKVTVISRDPDEGIHEKIAQLPMCTYERHFTVANLHHDVLNLFF